MIDKNNKLKDKNLTIFKIKEDVENYKNDEEYENLFNDPIMNLDTYELIQDFLEE